jgi:exosortase
MFMIPLPGIIYYQITFPLQLAASRIAEICLDLLQVPALRDGNLLILPNTTLQVAEACSGIRSLYSLLALAVAYGYLAEKSLWKRLVLAGLMIPLAVVSNGLRLTATGILTYFYGPGMAAGNFHALMGSLVFIIAVVGMLGVHWVLGFFGRQQEGH